jgi:hypothetical protein
MIGNYIDFIAYVTFDEKADLEVLRRYKVSPQAIKATIGALALFAQPNGTNCFAGRKRLAKAAGGISPAQLDRCTAAAAALGIAVPIGRARKEEQSGRWVRECEMPSALPAGGYRKRAAGGSGWHTIWALSRDELDLRIARAKADELAEDDDHGPPPAQVLLRKQRCAGPRK